MFRIRAYLYLEFKRFLDKRNLAAWVIVFLIMLFLTNQGINEQQTQNDRIQKFKQVQENSFQGASSYLFSVW